MYIKGCSIWSFTLQRCPSNLPPSHSLSSLFIVMTSVRSPDTRPSAHRSHPFAAKACGISHNLHHMLSADKDGKNGI